MPPEQSSDFVQLPPAGFWDERRSAPQPQPGRPSLNLDPFRLRQAASRLLVSDLAVGTYQQAQRSIQTHVVAAGPEPRGGLFRPCGPIADRAHRDPAKAGSCQH